MEYKLDKKDEKELYVVMNKYTKECIIRMSEEFKFDKKDAIKYLNLEEEEEEEEEEEDDKEKKRIKNKIILPFCGKINSECCNAIKLNYGLYTQCLNNINRKSIYCKTCSKQCIKNEKSKPIYGTIQERLDAGINFKDPKGKPAVRYANVMEKLNITKESAIEEASKLGLTIPKEEFDLKVVKRGRPKKSVAVSDTDSDSNTLITSKKTRTAT